MSTGFDYALLLGVCIGAAGMWVLCRLYWKGPKR